MGYYHKPPLPPREKLSSKHYKVHYGIGRIPGDYRTVEDTGLHDKTFLHPHKSRATSWSIMRLLAISLFIAGIIYLLLK